MQVRPTSSEAEEEISLAIHNAVWPDQAVTMDEVRSFKASCHAYTDHLAFDDGEAIGSGAVAILPQRPRAAFALLTVPPEHRRNGAGSALHGAVSRWAHALGLDTLEAPAEGADAESLAWATRRGFVEIERWERMVLDLDAFDPPAVEPPPGIEIVTWAERPELARGVYGVAIEAYADVPGAGDERMEPFEDWLAHDMQGSGDLPEATFIAVSDGEVVGYSKFSLTAAQPRVAHHDMTGVKRAWRRRGIAGALKCAQIAWAKQAGYRRLVTSNEERNAPILRLNTGLGYRVTPGRVLLSGPVAV